MDGRGREGMGGKDGEREERGMEGERREWEGRREGKASSCIMKCWIRH